MRTAEGIATAVERAVADQVVVPGDRLPTVRDLATRLGVSPNTVAAAYRTLGGRGIVTGRGRAGTRISAGPPLPVRAAPVLPPGVRDLTDGNPDPALLPPLAPVLHRLTPEPVTYGDARADRADLLELARAAFRADGIAADRVVVVPGALDGVERVLLAHLRPGDRVAVEDPGYARSFDLLAALGLVAVPMAIDDAGPRPDALATAVADGAQAVVITPRAQNPTGAAVTAARARALRQVLDRHPHVLAVEDDHAGPIAGARAHTVTHARLPRWAVVRSVAKSLGPDLRLATVTGDRTTVDRVEGRLRLGTGWVSHLLQQVVVALWEDPATDARVETAEATYATRRRALVDALADVGLPAHGVSGLNVWVPVPEEDTAIAGLLARGWAVTGGERFRLRTGPAVRITTARLVPADARRLAGDLAAAVAPGRGGGAWV